VPPLLLGAPVPSAPFLPAGAAQQSSMHCSGGAAFAIHRSVMRAQTWEDCAADAASLASPLAFYWDEVVTARCLLREHGADANCTEPSPAHWGVDALRALDRSDAELEAHARYARRFVGGLSSAAEWRAFDAMTEWIESDEARPRAVGFFALHSVEPLRMRSLARRFSLT